MQLIVDSSITEPLSLPPMLTIVFITNKTNLFYKPLLQQIQSTIATNLSKQKNTYKT